MNDQAAFAPIASGLTSAAEVAAAGIERALAAGRPSPAPPSRTLLVDTSDGVRIEADVFLPAGRAVAKVLVAPAMGVPRQFYAAFAADMAAHGIAAMTFDYRGVGGSLTGPIAACEARLSQWGEEDIAAVTAALAALSAGGEDPGKEPLPLLFVGHSVGGQLLGLMTGVPYRAALFIGSQSGYWGHWEGRSKAVVAAVWYAAVPVLTGTLGYLPMKALGQGEDIPRGVAREWAQWGRDRSYIGVRLAERPAAGFNTWTGKLRTVSIADDGYAPRRAVSALAGLYRKADTEVIHVHPGDAGVKRIGHFGWFKRHFRATLWADARRWLLAAGGIGAARA